MNRYYSLEQTADGADVLIFGDITSMPYLDSDVSSYGLVRELMAIDADLINVRINSYGGEVSEGLAIYNTLKQHNAEVHTYCDGMACSIASVIFMAGAERVMADASLLMLHNPWTIVSGNADELRQEADTLDVIREASIAAYGVSGQSKDDIRAMLDTETWLPAESALSLNFATRIDAQSDGGVSQSVKRALIRRLTAKAAEPPRMAGEQKTMLQMFSQIGGKNEKLRYC